MIVLLPGLLAGIIGVAVGYGLGPWKSIAVAALCGLVLYSLPWGILFAELPVGIAIGGMSTIGRKATF